MQAIKRLLGRQETVKEPDPARVEVVLDDSDFKAYVAIPVKDRELGSRLMSDNLGIEDLEVVQRYASVAFPRARLALTEAYWRDQSSEAGLAEINLGRSGLRLSELVKEGEPVDVSKVKMWQDDLSPHEQVAFEELNRVVSSKGFTYEEKNEAYWIAVEREGWERPSWA